jgi:hypothetical protein
MKNLVVLTLAVVMCLLFAINPARAQDPDPTEEMRVPFIDRDGDGVNDFLQNGWGQRFMQRYKMRQKVWEQLNIEIVKGEDGPKVDTDGDGVGDVDLREFMKSKMDEMIDTDGDGKPDTALRDYLGRRFKAFDGDDDGLPDNITKEEMRKHRQEMLEWRKEIRERLREGKSPFPDTDNDGVPDNLPPGFGWRGFNRGGSGRP